ncbi:hypothetical protein G1O98_26995 [Nostoc sp. UIC10630]|nr:hypothetical protein [Nostoc sp. UIC 10630]NEU82593.1 hypothetical protein [Nostoc sp. UIC 10630]
MPPRGVPLTVHCVCACRAGEVSSAIVAVFGVPETKISRGSWGEAAPCVIDVVVSTAAGTGPSEVTPGITIAAGRRVAVIVSVPVRCGELESATLIVIVRSAALDRSMSTTRLFCVGLPCTVTVVVIGVRPPSMSTTMRDRSGNSTVPAVFEVRTKP